MMKMSLNDVDVRAENSNSKSSAQDLILPDVRLFVKAVEAGGLTHAAGALGIPKATASRQLKRLESTLGHLLMHRSAHRFGLTDEGRSFLSAARDILIAVDDAMAQRASTSDDLRGRLRVSASSYFGRALLAPHLPAFMAAHPRLEITVRLGSHKVDLSREEADVLIRASREGCEDLVARRVASEPLVLCAAPSYLERRPEIKDLEDLAQHTFLTCDTERAGQEMIIPIVSREHSVQPIGLFRSNDPELLLRLACAGKGIALIPLILAKPNIEDGSLQVAFPTLELRPMEFDLMYLPGKRNSRKVRAFADYLLGALKQPAGRPSSGT
jgi:DNA-binding transcriptional LysR family regulator